MIEQLLKLSNSHVRNLSWLLFSPIIRVNEVYENEALLFPEELQSEWLVLHEKWLVGLDESPGELNEFIAHANNKGRLGFYAEYLLQFFFTNSPFVELVWFNEQVINEGITETEIDFVIRYNSRLIHIELAVKYYLLTPSDEWIGPNATDTFRKKWEKVNSLQIPTARRVINKAFPEEELESYFFIKGVLFTHDENAQNQWIYQREGNSIVENGSRFVFPEKPNWMADFVEYKGKTISRNEFKKLLVEGIKKATSLISLSKNKQKNYFIVTDDWPKLDNHC